MKEFQFLPCHQQQISAHEPYFIDFAQFADTLLKKSFAQESLCEVVYNMVGILQWRLLFVCVLHMIKPNSVWSTLDANETVATIDLLPATNIDIPAPTPPTPLLRPTTMVSRIQIQTPISSPVRVSSPPFEPPTVIDALCINSMRMADTNRDQRLTYDEYVIFMQTFTKLLTQCNGTKILANNTYLIEAFSLTRCFPNPKGCTTTDTLNITAFYIASNNRTVINDAAVITVCEIGEGLYKLLCSGPVPTYTRTPTNAPTRISTTDPQPVPVRCGRYGFSFFCPITGCGFLGRIFGLCQ